jgi:drug/metabolite transporter (DMT)-like permease
MLLSGGPGAPHRAGATIALLWLGLVISGVAYAIYFAAARELPSTHIVIIGLLEPVTATVIGAVAFHEPLTVGEIAGGILLLVAVAALRPPSRAPGSNCEPDLRVAATAPWVAPVNATDLDRREE